MDALFFILVPIAALACLLAPLFSPSKGCDDASADAADWREREKLLEQESSSNDRDQF